MHRDIAAGLIVSSSSFKASNGCFVIGRAGAACIRSSYLEISHLIPNSVRMILILRLSWNVVSYSLPYSYFMLIDILLLVIS